MYEVIASNSEGDNSNCPVGKTKNQATWEGLSPCTEDNVSVRAYHAKRSCGREGGHAVPVYLNDLRRKREHHFLEESFKNFVAIA